MPRTRTSRSWRSRAAAAGAALAMSSLALVATAGPADAVVAPPWAFKTVTWSGTIAGFGTLGHVLDCGAGWLPVHGGITTSNSGVVRFLEYADGVGGGYHIGLRNKTGSSYPVSLFAACATAPDIGNYFTDYVDFPRNNSTGRAGGEVLCPTGWRILTGNTDWTFTNSRTIDYSSPSDDGRGWFASGSSTTTNDLFRVEIRCVPDAVMAGVEVLVNGSSPGPGAVNSATFNCMQGKRLLTGGAYGSGAPLDPTHDHGYSYISGPDVGSALTTSRWWASGIILTGETLRTVAVCVPASHPTVTITQGPPSLTNSSQATVQFAGSDPTGETVQFTCTFDSGSATPCSPGIDYMYASLPDGVHTYSVTVKNLSGQQSTDSHSWQVDTTAPVVAAHSPASAASITGPHTITFSEIVQGASASSIRARANGATSDLAGTVTSSLAPSNATVPVTHTVATWTPSAPLTPGQTYRFTVNGAIHDAATNALIPTFWDVRAATTVENTSVALREFWDRDNRTIANGGSYITSQSTGSTATATFTATTGQTASLYGIRLPSGGNADIYLDGVRKTTASFYAATAARARVYLSPALTAGKHTLQVKVLGTKPTASTNTWVSVDNMTLGSTTVQETSFKQAFRRVASASASGGSYDTVVYATDTDGKPAFQLTFVGTGVKLFAIKAADAGKAQVFVDNVLKTTVNLSAATTTYKVQIYSSALSAGSHTVRLVPVGTATSTKSVVRLDYVSIT
jgi:Bacterial Ig-like domain